MTIQKLSDNF